MTVQLKQEAIDLGIVTGNPDAMVAFYRDLLGYVEEPQTPFPAGGVMYRLRCGKSLVKIVAPTDVPDTANPPGPLLRATGLRYFTMIVTNLQEIVAATEAAGHKTVVPISEVRPGVTIAMVEDPDGNWVEFVDMAG